MKRFITFGEIMLRLKSPGAERLFQSPVLEATFGGGENRVAASSPGRTDSMSTRAASLLRQPRWTDSALLYRAVTGGDEVAAYLAQLLEWARRERVDSPHLRAIADDLASR